MTDIKLLKVSLTKHGSHKVADLLENFEADDVLKNTGGTLKGVNINKAQARKTLSAHSDDRLPGLWHKAKEEGRPTINALVMVGIISSHWRLMRFVSDGVTARGCGRIERATVINNKVFTNFSDDFRALQFGRKFSFDFFEFDIRAILNDNSIGKLVGSLFEHRLRAANWSGNGDPIEECIDNDIHKVFGLSKNEFRAWTAGSQKNLDELADYPDNDTSKSIFKFSPGHKIRKTGEVVRAGHGHDVKARLFHNKLQNILFDHLSNHFGSKNVATEQKFDNTGASIDLIAKRDDHYIFYEIKTSSSLRVCIREALPQLIEYSCWPTGMRANELIIVTPNEPTTDARQFLKELRARFKLPIFHETIDATSGTLSNRI